MSDPIFVQEAGTKRLSSFFYLNITQFFLTLNDSIYRLLVVFLLIEQFGVEKSNEIIAVAAIVFILPFILFMVPSGCIADKYSKSQIIKWCRFFEIIIVGISIVIFYYKFIYASYLILFMLAIEAVIFTPAKYGIIPELLKKEQLSKANSYLMLLLYGAIVIGTFLGSFFTDITDRNYSLVACFCWIFSWIGWLTSLKIKKTQAADEEKQIRFWFISKLKESLKIASTRTNLLLAVLASPCFLFTAAYTQLNIIPFGLQTLGIDDVDSGYLFLTSAFGIGIGAGLVGWISGKTIELGLVPLGGIAAGFSVFLLGEFGVDIPLSILFLILLGISGALFTIPLDAYIQLAAPKEKRGEIIATSTFLGFVGVLFAAIFLGVLGKFMKVPAADGYIVIGWITIFWSVAIAFFIPNHLFRFFFVQIGRFFCRVELNISSKVKLEEQFLYICPHVNWLRYLALIKIIPRIYFFLPCIPTYLKPLRCFFRLFNVIPCFEGGGEHDRKWLLKRLDKTMKRGCSICFFVSHNNIEEDVDGVLIIMENNVRNMEVVSVKIKTESYNPSEMS